MKQLFTLNEPVDSINCASKLFDRIKKIDLDYTQENMLMVCLSSSGRVIDSGIIFKGGLTQCMVDPKTIYSKALLNNACNIILAHNHPSGSLIPSKEDLKAMKMIKGAGEIITIKLLDFIVFNRKEYYSCME